MCCARLASKRGRGSEVHAAQAEQEILQRNSFEAARRNSLSSSSTSEHSGGMPYNFEAIMGGSGAQQGPYLQSRCVTVTHPTEGRSQKRSFPLAHACLNGTGVCFL